MIDEQLRIQLAHYARRAYDRGLVGGTGGNCSVRLGDRHMLITPSGVSLGDTTVENLITVDIETLDWEPVQEWRPSKEFLFHAEILKRRPDVGAICHVHSPFATAYAVNRRDIPMVTDAAFKQTPMPRVPFAPSGTEELKEHVGRAIEANPGCQVLLLEEHGIVGLGTDVAAAYDAADLTEELARIAYLAGRLAGEEPRTVKLAVVTPTPEVDLAIPVALLSGSFAERMQKARKLGYDGVELLAVRPAEIDASAIRAAVSAAGLEIAAIGSGAVPAAETLTLLARDADTSRRAVDRLQQLIDFAAMVEAPLVTIGSFRGRQEWAGGLAGRAVLVDILRAAADRAASCGVRLVLEPLNRYETDIVCNADEGLALIDEVGHTHLGLLLDTFHMNIEEATFDRCVHKATASGRLWHVHLGDSNRLPPGLGHIDFGQFAGNLTATGYAGYLSAELLARPDADAAARATVEHMRRFVPIEGS